MRVLGQFLAQQALAIAGSFPTRAMRADLECARSGARTDEADKPSGHHD
jgi:hypothetical protein